MDDELTSIKELVDRGEVARAIRLLDDLVTVGVPPLDEAYYLRGNAYRKQGNWQQALNNYQHAIEINPQSPADQARRMVMDILNFYNKDIYNP
ncbi:MAG: tetratricopeptide repeat protein [Prevotellaceae bacterium]|jgi:tetratricopeptide (TPR) repeat protein|nr:tetratricopeptide repeat protein [Prevotellaceae bacterium]